MIESARKADRQAIVLTLIVLSFTTLGAIFDAVMRGGAA